MERDDLTFKKKLAGLGFGTYEDYLASPLWANFKEKYRKSGLPTYCMACGVEKTSLHHVSYARLGREDVRDVIPLCDPHHAGVHRVCMEKNIQIHHVHTIFQELFGLELSAIRGLFSPWEGGPAFDWLKKGPAEKLPAGKTVSAESVGRVKSAKANTKKKLPRPLTVREEEDIHGFLVVAHELEVFPVRCEACGEEQWQPKGYCCRCGDGKVTVLSEPRGVLVEQLLELYPNPPDVAMNKKSKRRNESWKKSAQNHLRSIQRGNH